MSDVLSHERATELFRFDAEAGCLARKKGIGAGRAGPVYGTDDGSGYRRVLVDGKRYRLHRLVFFVVNGEWPSGDIDHIDGNKANNALSNLRIVSTSVNLQNQRRARSDNASGHLGATWHKQPGKWRARITLDGKQRHLGHFETALLAHLAYVEAKRVVHAGCTI